MIYSPGYLLLLNPTISETMDLTSGLNEDGVLKVNVRPRKLKPIDEYQKLQRRFRHLSKEQIETLQREVSKDWESWLAPENMGKLTWY